MTRKRLFAVLGIGGALALGAGWMGFAQNSGETPANSVTPAQVEPAQGQAPPPVIEAPPPPPASPTATASANAAAEESANAAPASNAAAKQQAEIKPPAPPPAVRSPVAILRVLDKVTAETIPFAVQVGGQRVRYKNLVFQVKACETTGLGDPDPQASAYVVVDFEPLAAAGDTPAPKQVYHGWMFADTPGLHPLQHPVYDAWLIACSAAAPPT